MLRWIKQVIAPLLIVQRVADKSALTRQTVMSGRISEFKVTTPGESISGGGVFPGGDPTSLVDRHGVGSGVLEVEITTDSR